MQIPPRLSLAKTPTPIHRLKQTSLELDKDVYIWRDDLTGYNESGNKVRKLEFLLADAVASGCDWIVTCGGPQSNHTRATVALARQLGLGVTVVILPRPGFDRGKPATGNLLLNQIFDADLVWLDFDDFQNKGSRYDPFLEKEVERLRAEFKNPYVIPLGGSNALGCFGYRIAMKEMLSTWKKLQLGSTTPDSIFCAMGSGGTMLGLQLGLQDHQLDSCKLFGINVTGTPEVGAEYISRLSREITESGEKLTHKNTFLIDGYVGEGYSVATNADLEYYVQIGRNEGILLDPCYTGKAFKGMIAEVKKDPIRFGRKILFLHSGGGFANFAYAEQYQEVLGTNA